MKNGNCKLCLIDKELAHSHIFSEFLYKPVYDDEHKYIAASTHPHHKPKPFQKGMREHLLCKECEQIISKYETYSANLLNDKDIDKYRTRTVHGPAFMIPDFDYQCFKLFGLSLIWRSHITNLEMFKEVNLGSHAEKIRQMLLNNSPGEPYEYCFVLVKIDGASMADTIICSPQRRRFRDHCAYAFMAYGFDWIFIVSSHSHNLPEDYPLVGMKTALEIPVRQTTDKEFIVELRRKFSPDLLKKLSESI